MEEPKINIATQEARMKKHVVIVGAIHIGFGIIGLIGAVAIYFGLTIAKGFVPYNDMPAGVAEFIKFLFISLPLLIGFLSSVALVGGLGLLNFQLWARYVVIVVAIIGLLNIPIGTLKGVYSLWVLFQDETIRLFEKK